MPYPECGNRMASSRRKSYVRVEFATLAAMADEAAGILVARGALGCAVVGDTLATHRRRVVRLEAFFDRLGARALAQIRRALDSAGMLASDRAPEAGTIVDPGWATAWMERFEPFAVGRRFLIAPPWASETRPGRTTIVIRPGQAFGTGHHPTTYGMLRAIERLCAANRVTNALDAGTGSGILAIAMTLLGVSAVTAVDIDSEALVNARENAALNGCAPEFSTRQVSSIRRRFALVTANILSSTLISLAPALTRVVSRDGRLVLGGILAREAASVLAAYQPTLTCAESRIDRGWATLVLAR